MFFIISEDKKYVQFQRNRHHQEQYWRLSKSDGMNLFSGTFLSRFVYSVDNNMNKSEPESITGSVSWQVVARRQCACVLHYCAAYISRTRTVTSLTGRRATTSLRYWTRCLPCAPARQRKLSNERVTVEPQAYWTLHPWFRSPLVKICHIAASTTVSPALTNKDPALIKFERKPPFIKR